MGRQHPCKLIVAAVPGADVCDVEGVRSSMQDVLQHFGKLDIFIANAGAITSFTPREDPLPFSSRLPPLPFPPLFALGLTLHSFDLSAEQEKS
jgi:NAD(P)-dependent dehydrogenase (short-subunit alcohol dehydrogenase family)